MNDKDRKIVLLLVYAYVLLVKRMNLITVVTRLVICFFCHFIYFFF